MKIFYFLSLLVLLSSCSILEDEVFKNTDNQAMLEEDLIKDKKSPLNLTVKFVERLGADTLIHGTLNDGGELVLRLDGVCEIESNQILNLSFPVDLMHLFDAKTGKRIESV